MMIKSVLLVTAMSLSAAASAHSDRHAQRLADFLELDESRKVELQEAFDEINKEAEHLRAEHKEERLALRQKRRQLLSDILTEDELKKLEDHFEKRGEKFHKRDALM